ncbi:MAG: hypothetical protein CM15mP68_1800 [Pseudomonadota bacterium]|nr:MAG: hypothetical protein CM15mP68_1800 [Pseudomonadota bacterium]
MAFRQQLSRGIMRLENKVAVITGGAGGIGKRRPSDLLQRVPMCCWWILMRVPEAACGRIGSNRVSFLVGDVTRAVDNQAMIDTATERYGGVDIFLANAGIEGCSQSVGLSRRTI